MYHKMLNMVARTSSLASVFPPLETSAVVLDRLPDGLLAYRGWEKIGNTTERRVIGMRVESSKSTMVAIETELGTIEIEVFPDHAPITTANFLHYVENGSYDGGRFHRTVKMDNQPNNTVLIEVIQARINPDRVADASPPIPLERTTVTGLAHRDGTISMARFAPDSANYDFFICIGDQPELDYGGKRYEDGQGFAAFGRVVRGMDIVRAIQQAPAEGQRLTPPIGIVSARATW